MEGLVIFKKPLHLLGIQDHAQLPEGGQVNILGAMLEPIADCQNPFHLQSGAPPPRLKRGRRSKVRTFPLFSFFINLPI